MIAAYSVGQSMWVIRYFICASNIVETPFTYDVGNNTRSHCTKRLCYTVHYPTHGTFLIPESYLQSLNSRTLSLFTTAAQNLHQWSECHAKSFGQDDVSTNPANDATRGSRGGGRDPDPSPLENHKFYRFI